MITQRSPFQGDNEDEIYDAILTSEPSFPAYLTMDTTDFIRNLLVKQPAKRLGSGINGPDRVMAHEFFSEINWNDLYHKRVLAPFIPTVSNPTDVSNFDSEFTLQNMPAIIDTPEGISSKSFNRVITEK
jgi:serine/threonine protein kinase